ncbi:DeoR/GlpR family DNA-binding transcription regulator [Vibrio sp. SS-MA-C1-2]|uniref:DeoR/GlpR family DNA-binding transcription regulator n=1 Tax=Vibrio sp. SS-MA-C1-2 TaxID=2908646 RepID=UPI001F1BAC71|nr:DeoR/GlpR family DNA-binding transcription regulator [Vibrio sp. SS-MA-C1-2]UJF18243.1 DeoR/GlpR family DNA-binding transcription regulator [Vibrio sp. SS-MA-C1-2]
MIRNPRQEHLYKLVNKQGYCSVDELAEELDVSTQTIRRDIKKMSDVEMIIRHHGGASSISSTVNLDFDIRKNTDVSKKDAIGKMVADSIPEGASLFLTIGTTTEAIAQHLVNKKNLQIMTNSVRIANLLYKHHDVVTPSGKIKAFNGGIVGSEAMNFISKFRFDYLITSAGSIDSDGSFLDYDMNEVEVVQMVKQNSRQTIVALDSTKFIPKGSIELFNIGDITTFFSDVEPPSSVSLVAKEHDVEVKVF